MSAGLELTGVAELLAALQHLPGQLTSEGRGLVNHAANEAAQRMRVAYPRSEHPQGQHLADSVDVKTLDSGPVTAAAMVINHSPHALVFEVGSGARRTSTGAYRGSMPAGHVFVPIEVTQRRALVADLIALVVRAGFVVKA
jgi:hypothetical protein